MKLCHRGFFFFAGRLLFEERESDKMKKCKFLRQMVGKIKINLSQLTKMLTWRAGRVPGRWRAKLRPAHVARSLPGLATLLPPPATSDEINQWAFQNSGVQCPTERPFSLFLEISKLMPLEEESLLDIPMLSTRLCWSSWHPRTWLHHSRCAPCPF